MSQDSSPVISLFRFQNVTRQLFQLLTIHFQLITDNCKLSIVNCQLSTSLKISLPLPILHRGLGAFVIFAITSFGLASGGDLFDDLFE